MTNARKSRARHRAQWADANRGAGLLNDPHLVDLMPPLSRQRAMQGPYRAPEGMHRAGQTNADALADLVRMLGGPPERGRLYRVTMMQGEGAAGRPGNFVGEYVGLGNDGATTEAGDLASSELALGFVVRNPMVPADAYGGETRPLILWPLDCLYMAPAEPGDMDNLGMVGPDGVVRFTPGAGAVQ